MRDQEVERLTELHDAIRELQGNGEYFDLYEGIHKNRLSELWLEIREWTERPWEISKEQFVSQLSRIDELMKVLDVPKMVRLDLKAVENPQESIKSRGE